jgi:hypothetical protein
MSKVIAIMLAGTPFFLGNPIVTQGVGVTHLRYPVRKAQSGPRPVVSFSSVRRSHATAPTTSSTSIAAS